MTSLGRSAGALQGVSRHLLTGLLRCGACGNRMSMQGNSYRCQTARLGRTCAAPAGVYQETLDDAVKEAWMLRLTSAERGDPLLDAVADRWSARHHPEAVAKRMSVLHALDRERAALRTLDEDHYIRRTMDGERYLSLAAALSRRIDALEQTLSANPVPEAEIAALLDSSLARLTWAAADVSGRRRAPSVGHSARPGVPRSPGAALRSSGPDVCRVGEKRPSLKGSNGTRLEPGGGRIATSCA